MVGSQVTFRLVKYLSYTFFNGLNMFLIPINMSTFRFRHSKKFVQLLVLQKFSIITFGPSFKVNSYVGTKNIVNIFSMFSPYIILIAFLVPTKNIYM